MTSFRMIFSQPSIILIFLFVSPSFARISVEVTKSEINNLCSKTLNRSFCLSLLKSTPGVGTPNYLGLAKITLQLSHSDATKTLNLVKSLILRATSPQLKVGYAACSKHYENMRGDFDDAKQDLKTGDAGGLNVHISAAMDEAADCKDELEGLKADPSVLRGSQDLPYISNIIWVISNLLHQ